MTARLLALALLLTAACRNAPIEDGARFGPWTQVKTSFTSAFVAETSEGVVLVDAGFAKDAGPIEDHLADRDLTLADVELVLLTHGHSDHVRGLPAYPNATVRAHRDEGPILAEEAPDGVTIDTDLAGGDVIVLGDLTVLVFHVPGHTPGSLALLSEGVLLTGDVAMSYKDGRVGPPPERYSEDPDQARRELLRFRDRLQELGQPLEAVVFAHSKGLRDPEPFWAMDGSAPGHD